MGLFSFLSGKKRVKGTIGYFGLEEWWLSAFSEKERQYIRDQFQPVGFSSDSLTSGDISYTSQTSVGFLNALAGWFMKKEDRPLAYKILKKAEELSRTEATILDVHFLYGQKLSIYYKDRQDSRCLGKAIEACKQQIALAVEAAKAFRSEYKGSPLPSHKGYEQLAIILEKQMKFDEAIRLCAQAKKQGWAGDWEKRTDRCRRKMEKV